MKGNDLRELVKSKGLKETCAILMECIDQKELKPEDFSLRELWEAFVGPTGTTLAFAKRNAGYVQLQEAAVDSSVYQILVGKVISTSVIEAYNRVASIGDQLVSNYPSKQRFDKIPGFTPTQGVKTVREGDPYETTGFGIKFVGTGEAYKKGRILAITEEAIFFDQTGEILNQASQLGEDARLDKEKTILRAVLGIDTCYFPSDTPTALYGGVPYLVASNPLTDWLNVEAAELSLSEMQDEEGNTIIVAPKVILVPSALYRTGQRIIKATDVTHKTPTTGDAGKDAQAIETKSANPMMDNYAILSSPLVHQLQVAAGVDPAVAKSNWWIGDPRRQFNWKEIWALQVLKAKEDSDAQFDADIAARFKVRFYGGVFARDNKYFIKNKLGA